MRNARPAGVLLLGLALLVCGVAGDRVMERAEVAPPHARVQTTVVVQGGRVVGVVHHVQLGRRFGPPELPPGAPDPAAECGQPQGFSGLLDWAACLVRCMRSRHDGAAPHMGAQMGMVHMQLAHAAAAQGQPVPLVRVVGGGATPGSLPKKARWQWDENMPVPAEQQGVTDEDMVDSATAQQLLDTEPAAAAAAEPEPRAAPWWWPAVHVRRPARGVAAGGDEPAAGCRCRHCGCHHHGAKHHHHGAKHHHHEHEHHHSHSDEEQPGTAQQLPMMMAALHDLAQQRVQQVVEAQRAQRAARHGNHQTLLPGVATPVELIAREQAAGFDRSRWAELEAAQRTAGPGMNWSLWDASGRLNWGLAAFVALAVACAGVWSAMLAQCALYRSARANNNAAEVLAAQYYHHMPSEEAEAGDADLKPLLREGPVKGAIAVVDAKL